MLLTGLLALILYAVGFILNSVFHVNGFQALPALWLVLVQPGLLVGSWWRNAFKPIERFALSIPLSIAISGISALFLYRIFPDHVLQPAFTPLALSAITIILLGISSVIMRAAGTFPTSISLPDWKNIARRHWPILTALGTYVLLHIINGHLYQFIPEADGYTLILRIRQILSEGGSWVGAYRPLFTSFVSLLSQTTGIEPVTLFKWVLPLVMGATAFYPYLFARDLSLSKPKQLVAALLTFSFPIIVNESNYIRPQVVIILFSFAAIWLLTKAYATGKTALTSSWNMALAFGFIGLGFHEFSVFILLAAIIVAIPAIRETWKKNPGRVLLTILYLAFAFFPYTQLPSSITTLSGIAKDFLNQLHYLHFEPWFIDSYKNSDGNNLGWPGYLTIFYYGYNLGIAFLILAIMRLKKTKPLAPQKYTLPLFAFLATPVFFAEIGPHFGIVFLPDRSWLFISIALVFCSVALLKQIQTERILRIFTAVVLCSIAFSSLVVWMKQGWISQDEYQAVSWIKTHTAPNAIFITQSGTVQPLRVYGERDSISIPKFFSEPQAGKLTSITDLEHLPPTLLELRSTDLIIADILRATDSMRTTTNQKILEINTQQLHELTDELSHVQKVTITSTEQPAPKKVNDLYVMYSSAKFRGIYGSRGWWRTINEYGISPELITSPHFQKVYNVGETTIWKISQ